MPPALQDKKKTEFLFSKEGVGQGDPLPMLMYAAAVMPLFKSLSRPSTWVQNWSHLREWFVADIYGHEHYLEYIYVCCIAW